MFTDCADGPYHSWTLTATYVRRNDIFTDDFITITNLLTGLPVKEFSKSVSIWRSYTEKSALYRFLPTVYNDIISHLLIYERSGQHRH